MAVESHGRPVRDGDRVPAASRDPAELNQACVVEQIDPELAERKRREAENRAELRVWRSQEDGAGTRACA
jgi:hypothetical protein